MIKNTKKYHRGSEINDLVVGGLTVREACSQLGCNYNNGRRCLHIYRRASTIETVKSEFALPAQMLTDNNSAPVEFPSEVYTGEHKMASVPMYTGCVYIEGDCVVAGDYQLPTTDWMIAEWVYQVGLNTGIKNLILAGDWVNCDAFSTYTPFAPPINFFDECKASRALLSRYATHFDNIVLLIGNHERRLLKHFSGVLTTDEIMRHLSDDIPSFRVSMYPYAYVNSSGIKWRVSHPREYSIRPAEVGNTLAQKHQCNLILGHQHHVGKTVDRFGRYVIIDNGGVFKYESMAYVALEDSKSPVMHNGFTVIRGGVGHLITPYPAYTDLKEWGLG
jgi:hypothetical protein